MTHDRQQFDARLTHGAPFFSLFMVGLAVAALFDPKTTARVGARESTADCQSWDRAAVEGLIPLMYQVTAAAELKLNEGISQLRRARQYCKEDFVAVARSDYTVLHKAFPVLTGAIGSPAKIQSMPASTDERLLIELNN
jgi:hypothetical protein